MVAVVVCMRKLLVQLNALSKSSLCSSASKKEKENHAQSKKYQKKGAIYA